MGVFLLYTKSKTFNPVSSPKGGKCKNNDRANECCLDSFTVTLEQVNDRKRMEVQQTNNQRKRGRERGKEKENEVYRFASVSV